MLKIKDVSKSYSHLQKIVPVLNNINVCVEPGEFVALVGPSGCGKTTLLRLVAGLEQPTSGIIECNNQLVNTPGQERGMVFQDGALFPWLTVGENIAFGLQLQKVDSEDIQKRVEHYLSVTGLADFKETYPQALSGGMKQRVAFARMLATQPQLLLLDEPFAALDTQTRSKMQDFLAELWEKEKKMVVLVTHDVREAIFLADTVYVCSGRPAQIKKVFKIPFLRPRTHVLKYSQQFFDLEKEVTQTLENE